MKYFKCFSAKLAGELIRNNQKLIRKEVNLKKPELDVFIFEDTEELRAIFDSYCRNR